jgi:hypothetical protein
VARTVIINLIGQNNTSRAFRQVAGDADRAADRVDRLGSSADGASGRMSALTGRTATLAAGLLALAPAAQAAGAAMVAGAGAAAAAFGSAGAALGAFGLAAKGQLTGVQSVSDAFGKAQDAAVQYGAGSEQARKATELYNKQLAALPPATRETAKAFVGLRKDFQSWSDSLAPVTMPIFTRGINLLREILPKLTTLVRIGAASLDDFMASIEDGVKGGGFDAFMGEVNKAAADSLPALLRSVKNVGVGIVGIFRAFLPHAGTMARGVEGLTAKFAAWGQSLRTSETFKVFIDYVRRNLPALSLIFSNLVTIVTNLALAFGPLSGISLQVIAGFTGILAALPPPVLQALVTAFIGLRIALAVLIPVQRALNVVMAMNPIGIVVLALAGLALGLYTAYKRSETFRNIVNTAWGVIKTAVYNAWTAYIKPALEGVGNLFRRAYQTWQEIWPKIKGILTQVINFWDVDFIPAIGRVTEKFTGLGGKADETSQKVKGVGQGFKESKDEGNRFLSWGAVFGAGIGMMFGGPLGAAIGAMTYGFWPKIKSAWSEGWSWTKTKGLAFMQGILGDLGRFVTRAVAGFRNWMSRAKQALFGGLPPLKLSWSGFWNWVASFTQRLIDVNLRGIRNFLSNAGGAFRKGVDGIQAAWSRLSSVAKKPVNFIIGSLYNNGIRSLVNSIARLVGMGAPLGKISTFARGGVMPGYAPGRDSLLAAVSPGESIFRPEFTKAVGPQFVGEANAVARRQGPSGVRKWLSGPGSLAGEGLAFARGGIVPGFAGRFAFGGIIGDFIKGVKDFMLTNPVKGAEKLIGKILGSHVPGSGQIRDIIAGIPGWLKSSIIKWVKDKLGAFGGGPGISRAISFAKSQAGKPYIWGGVGPRGYDCSGFMSALVNVIKGRSPYSRLFTTHSFGASGPGGFVRNARSGFTVGVTNAGVGHMAGTLANRYNVESSGSAGVRFGGGARGTTNGLFTHRYGLKMDDGGMLMPGWNPPIYNGLGRPEPVLTPDQFGALAGGRGISLNVGPVYLNERVDIDLLMQQIEFRLRAAGF